MKPRAVLITACIALIAALSACTAPGGRVSSAAGEPATRHSAVITVGSFDFPESVLLAQIYGQALLDTGTLRALDARVELAGQNPRLVAGSWLRPRADPGRG
jgi:glycine betaine/choline ABC-type transport system substrate-binding protein